MKILFYLLILIGFTSVNAQAVTDYKYIIIPQSFTSFENDQFHLGPLFKQSIQKKNYIALSEDSANWPAEMRNNPCNALVVDMVKTSNWRKNVLNVEFKNCDGKLVQSFNGESRIKEYKEGYQDAMKIALNSLKFSQPKEMAVVIPEPKSIPEAPTSPKLENPKVTSPPSSSSLLQAGTEFKNENTTVYLVGLKEGSFGLIDQNSSKMILTLKPTSRQGIFQVSVLTEADSYSTVGYFDGTTLGIDFLNASKEFELKEFKKIN